jgi:hypothetical protein
MGEESPALPSEAPVTAGISHRRLLVEMAVLVAAGSITGGLAAGPRFGIGVLFGGLLAYLNYFWLKRTLAAVFDKALFGGQGRLLPFKFIARYVALGVVILAVHFSGVIPAAAVVAGLASFAAAVVVDGFISIFRRDI